jgi:hypothetical protein
MSVRVSALERRGFELLTIQVVSRHEQFKAELRRNVKVGDTGRVTILFVIVKVLADLLEHHAIDVLKRALVGLWLCKAVWKRELALIRADRKKKANSLLGSSILLMAPERQADFLCTKNSKPSLLTSVT